jgi:hypothetical protein
MIGWFLGNLPNSIYGMPDILNMPNLNSITLTRFLLTKKPATGPWDNGQRHCSWTGRGRLGGELG